MIYFLELAEMFLCLPLFKFVCSLFWYELTFKNFFQTEVTTVICGQKEMKTLVNISGQLDTVKRVICMDDDIPSDASSIAYNWTITSFSEVQRLGRENPVEADLPLSADVAVIMYTSGSTGLPKVRSIFEMCSSPNFNFLYPFT